MSKVASSQNSNAKKLISGFLLTSGLMLAMEIDSQVLAATFEINRSFDGGKAIGTITTDSLGSLGASNFTSWDITIARGTDTATDTFMRYNAT